MRYFDLAPTEQLRLDTNSRIAGLLPLRSRSSFLKLRCVAPQLLYGYNEQVGQSILVPARARLVSRVWTDPEWNRSEALDKFNEIDK